MRKFFILFISLISSVLIISCGSEDTPVAATQPAEAVATEVPVSIPKTEPQPQATSSAPSPKPTNVPIEAPMPTPEPSPAVKIPNIFDEFGFSLTLDSDSNIWDSDLVKSGLLEGSPNNNQGVISFEYKGVDTSLIWAPAEGESNEELVEFGYFILSDSQPENVFTPINSGGLKVAESDGNFAAFIISDSSGSDAGGGLIAGWNCSNDISYTLVTTGPDSTALQIRFNNIVSGFSCE